MSGKTVVGIAASAVLAAGAALCVGASGAGAASDTEAFYIVESGATSTVAAHGVFNASGVDIEHSQKDVLVFPDGAISIYHPDSDSTFTYKVNPATCVARIKVAGAYTLGNGKRAYAGISGSGTYKGSGTDTLARKSDGSCDFDSEPVSGTFVIHASGPISFDS